MIEVKNTDNIYFERAILFVRPHCADLNFKLLENQSKQYLEKIGGYSGLKENEMRRKARRKKRLIYGVFCAVSGVVAGAITALVLNNLANIIK